MWMGLKKDVEGLLVGLRRASTRTCGRVKKGIANVQKGIWKGFQKASKGMWKGI